MKNSPIKNVMVHIVEIAAAIAIIVTVVSFDVGTSRGQSSTTRTKATVNPAVRISNRNSAAGMQASSSFAAAATQNATLKNELNWTFGGKPQRGWYLYELLLGQALNTQSDSGTSTFAAALAVWQKKRGLSPNGVLDEVSFMTVVSQWQSDRLKDRTPAKPDQLLTAPASDFYDPQRAAELRQVERNTFAAYKQMVAAAIADPKLKVAHTAAGQLAPSEKYLKIISAFRSREYQDQLRRESPNAGSAGLAVNSPHFTGRALDLYVGGSPVDTKDSNRAMQVKTPAYQWLVRNAGRFGFRPYFYEPWHWEYVR